VSHTRAVIVRSVPTGDLEFRRAVDDAAADLRDGLTIEALLLATLRPLYPAVSVHRQSRLADATNGAVEVWYAYRDGPLGAPLDSVIRAKTTPSRT